MGHCRDVHTEDWRRHFARVDFNAVKNGVLSLALELNHQVWRSWHDNKLLHHWLEITALSNQVHISVLQPSLLSISCPPVTQRGLTDLHQPPPSTSTIRTYKMQRSEHEDKALAGHISG